MNSSAAWKIGQCLLISLLFVRGAAADPAAAPPAPPVGAQSAAPVVALDPDSDSGRRAEAEALRLRALQYYDAGDYEAARRDFERANQLRSSFRLLYNLGVVSLALSDPASAYDYFERCLASAGSDLPEERRSGLAQQLQVLSARTALLTIAVDTAGAIVLLDDQVIGVAPLAGPVRRNPGTLRVSARLPDGRSVSRSVGLAAGQALRLELDLIVPPPPLIYSAKVSPARQVPWAGWAATAALATGAVVAGLEALSTQRSYERSIANIGTSRAELDRLDTRTTRWSVTADTLTGAAILVGAYSLYLSLRPARTPSSASHNLKPFPIGLQADRSGLGISF